MGELLAWAQSTNGAVGQSSSLSETAVGEVVKPSTWMMVVQSAGDTYTHITIPTPHTQHHTIKITHLTSHTQHHTLNITHSTSHNQHHTLGITHSNSHT